LNFAITSPLTGAGAFEKWFAELDPAARAKVTVAIARLEQGNLSSVKSVGEGVLEYRIDWGPGYRVYFGRDGAVLVILLTGAAPRSGNSGISSQRSRCGVITAAANAGAGERSVEWH
jgi:putative addiction module killer protein